MHSKQFVDEMKLALLAQKAKLTEDLSGLSAHTEMGSDAEANSDEVNVDEVSQDVIAIMKADLEKIEKALAKIDTGTYGTDNDGKEISEARLKVIPWADKSI